MQCHRPSVRAGSALVVVLVVVVMLSYACYRFVDRAAVELLAARADADLSRLATCVDSGEELVRSLLRESPVQRKLLGGTYNNSELFRGRVVFGNEMSYDRERFTILSPRIAEGKVAGLRFGLIDESSKISLQALMQWDKLGPNVARDSLLQLPGMTDPIADAILDWMDADSIPREQGAEADDYFMGGATAPRALPRNAPPNSLDELLLVRGVTQLALFGADRNANFHVGKFEQLESFAENNPSTSIESLPWQYYLTPFSAERNRSRDGRSRVNLNSPDLRLLNNELTRRFSKDWAQFIIAYRMYGPVSHTTPPPEASPSARSAALGSPSTEGFRIESVYDLIGARVLIPSHSNSADQVLESPFSAEPMEMQRYLLEFVDQVTTDPRAVLTGRVNINRALPEVLRAVPGIDEELAGRILSARGDVETGDDKEHYHEAWLVVEGLVTPPQMKQIEPFITTRGDVFRGQVVGFSDRSPLTVRAEVVIDATARAPRTVLRRDLRRFGRGYSLDVLLGDRLSSIGEDHLAVR